MSEISKSEKLVGDIIDKLKNEEGDNRLVAEQSVNLKPALVFVSFVSALCHVISIVLYSI